MTRANSFDDVRLAAALAVLAAHCAPAYGAAYEMALGGFFLGSLAVFVFFTLSGYLIAQSWESDPNVRRFLARRALRILPALLVVVLVSAFIIGPVFTTLPAGAYLADAGTWRYLANAVFVLVLNLPGVFQSHPEPELGVNPPLWSLFYEAMCYAGLVLAATLCKRANRLAAPLLFAGVVVLTAGVMAQSQRADIACLCFALGFALYRYRDVIQWRADLGFLAFAVLALSPTSGAAQDFAMVAALGYTAVAFGRGGRRPLRWITKHGDLSYGTYIFAYPVQHIVNELLGFNSHWLVSCALCLAVTLPLAWLSWRFIERPALGFKPRAATMTRHPNPEHFDRLGRDPEAYS